MYLEEQLSDKTRKEEGYVNEIKNSKKELMSETKDIQQKFEDQIKALQISKSDLEEQLNDISAQF